jgi:hypothetical protein
MRTHLLARPIALTLGIVLLGHAAGCIFIASDESKAAPRATVGRQLTDLKVARDNGAIDDQEYQRTKAKLLSDCK